jgi:hypothetical protein
MRDYRSFVFVGIGGIIDSPFKPSFYNDKSIFGEKKMYDLYN